MKLCSRFFYYALAALSLPLASCSLFVTRPVQDMSDTSAAIKAAREVQADTLAPELYRQASEWYFKSRTDYRLKNFKEAREEALKARRFAEQAEFEAVKSGANRTAVDMPAPPPPPPAEEKYSYPSPAPVPIEAYDQNGQLPNAKPQGGHPSPGAGALPPTVTTPPTPGTGP